jgi:hypothetical protein
MSDDALIYEASQHLLATLIWTLNYIKNHDLTLTENDRPDILEYHLNRLDALFADIVSDEPLFQAAKQLIDENKLTPNDLLQRGLADSPNVDVTLPSAW